MSDRRDPVTTGDPVPPPTGSPATSQTTSPALALSAADATPKAPPLSRRRWYGLAISPLTARRLDLFRANRRAVWSLRIFLVLFIAALLAEVIANERPILLHTGDRLLVPVAVTYFDTEFEGGFLGTEAKYYEDWLIEEVEAKGGWMLWPPVRFSYNTMEYIADPPPVTQPPTWLYWFCWPVPPEDMSVGQGRVRLPLLARLCPDSANLPADPDEDPAAYATRARAAEAEARAAALALGQRLGYGRHILGTDSSNRDIFARLLYGFRISVLFALVLTTLSSAIGIAAGAIQGYFGGLTDLVFQRIIEIWSSLPALYMLLIISSFFAPGFFTILFILLLFSWMALVGVVRAEFLRVRNFDYIRAARALGVGSATIMWRHMLPNGMVATLSLLPFQLSAAVTTLTALDFLSLGMPKETASLGEMLLQAKNNLHAPWIGISVFITLALILSLLTFIGEGVRDAFDPRKSTANPAEGGR